MAQGILIHPSDQTTPPSPPSLTREEAKLVLDAFDHLPGFVEDDTTLATLLPKLRTSAKGRAESTPASKSSAQANVEDEYPIRFPRPFVERYLRTVGWTCEGGSWFRPGWVSFPDHWIEDCHEGVVFHRYEYLFSAIGERAIVQLTALWAAEEIVEGYTDNVKLGILGVARTYLIYLAGVDSEAWEKAK